MSKEFEADYGQNFLLPPSLEDWIGLDHPARFIRDMVEQFDLAALGFARKSEVGAPSYSKELLLKIWLYGFFERIRSVRQLERACLNHLGFIWLTGQHYPDHNTLWRFWRDNHKDLHRLFRQSVQVAVKLNLVGMALHALDGTRIQSAASSGKGLYKGKLEKALTHLDAKIKEYEQAVETAGAVENDGAENRLPASLQQAQQRKERIQSALQELETRQATHFHPGDPDSEVVRCDRGLRWGYNAQAAADEKSGIVVGADVFNESADKVLLNPMLQEIRQTLGMLAQTTVADAGYNTDAQIGQAAEMGAEVLVSEHGQGKEGPFACEQFHYDQEKDCYVCPQGHELPYMGTDKSRKHPRRRYRCRNYNSCPRRMECSKSKVGRVIIRTPFADAVQEHNLRRDLPENREKLKKRKSIIEHIFGWMKQSMGFRQWSVRGLEKVRGQWALLCTVWNLKALYRHWRVHGLPPKTKTRAIAVGETVKTNCARSFHNCIPGFPN